MNLTAAQKTTLKTHLLANTNVITVGSDQPVAINVSPGVVGGDPTYQIAIATWYATLVAGTENQLPTPIVPFCWNPNATEVLLSTAVDWTTSPPHGLGGSPTVDQQQLAIGNKWWLWDQLIGRKGYIDMTDPQARNGITQVFGNIGPVNTNTTTSSAIGSETINPLVGKVAARRFDLVFAPAAVGAKTAWNAARVIPKDANGVTLLTQTPTAAIIADALATG